MRQTRKRTYQDVDPETYSTMINPETKIYVSNQKFCFLYSIHKDGSVKSKSDFIGVREYGKIENMFSLNYIKKCESLMLTKFKEKPEKVFNEEEILNKHIELVKYFDNQKMATKMAGR